MPIELPARAAGTRTLTPVADYVNIVTTMPPPDSPIEEKQCRICLDGQNAEEELGRLIRPCLCKGSISVCIQ
jgi:hypothetical protein